MSHRHRAPPLTTSRAMATGNLAHTQQPVPQLVAALAKRGPSLTEPNVPFTFASPNTRRRPEAKPWRMFEIARPLIVGAPLDAVVHGL